MEFAEVLQSLGLNKNAARIVTYLKDVDRASSRNIETATGLRQPEVSIGTRTLREKGWIEESEVNGNGKGRPHKLYSMRTNIDEIIKHYEMQKMQEAAKTVEDIQRLKELSSA
jgi:predicted transcriptional regulator